MSENVKNDEMIMGNVVLGDSNDIYDKKDVDKIKDALEGITEEDIKNSILNNITENTISAEEKKTESSNKKEKVLPKIGTKFMVDGQMYKVTYINFGQGRFSSEPCDNHY